MPKMIRVALFNDTRASRHYGCKLVVRNLLDTLRAHGMEVVWSWPVGKDWRKHRRRMPERGAIDLVIVNGEGSIHHNRDRSKATALAEVATFARDRLGVPAALVNATLYRNDKALYRELGNFAALYVRDSMSASELEEHGLSGKVVPDLTFARDLPASDVAPAGTCGTDSVVPEVSERIREACRTHGWAFRAIKLPAKARLKQIVRPVRFARRTWTWLSHGRGVPDDPEFFARYLASHRLVVTGRYHAVTMCLVTRTPFVAFESNTPKVTALLEDVFGCTRRVRSIETLGDDYAAWAAWTERETQALDGFLVESRGRIDAMAAELRALASAAGEGVEHGRRPPPSA